MMKHFKEIINLGEGLKSKLIRTGILVVAVLVIIFIGAGMGTSGAKVDLNGKRVDALQLQKDIAKLYDKKDDIQKQIDDKKRELADQKAKNQEVFDMIAKKDEYQSELNDVKSKLSDAQSQLTDTKSQLKDAQTKLAKLNGDILKAKGAPKTLSSGQYIVGHDIPAGRYKASAVGRGSNFFVYDDSGTPVVNTILGNSMVGTGDYVFACDDGYVIQTEAPVKLTPVE